MYKAILADNMELGHDIEWEALPKASEILPTPFLPSDHVEHFPALINGNENTFSG